MSAGDESTPLQVNQSAQRNETEVEKLLKESEEAFKPKPVGRCCINAWQWYFCPSPFLSECFCEVDHLAAHLFIVTLGASVYVAIEALSQQFYTDLNLSSAADLQTQFTETFEFWFFVAVGVGIVLSVWGFVQMGVLYTGRLKAAKILDSNNVLRAERFKLDINIQKTHNVRNKLSVTQGRKDEIKGRFKKLYSNLRDRQQDLTAVTNVNGQIGAVLQHKYLKLLDEIKEELVNSERSVILSIYNNMHLQDGEIGMDYEEFTRFVKKLPTQYQKRFKLQIEDFDRFTKGDGIFHRNDLLDVLYEITEEEATKI